MYRILPLLGDVGLGILSIVFISFWYGRYELNALLLMPFAFLPDIDALPEFFARGRVAASTENPHDHREHLHKPILWLVVLCFAWLLVGYYGAIVFVMIFFHFMHDSVLTGWGVPWLAPFSPVRIKFFVNEKNENSFTRKDWVRFWTPEELTQAIVLHGDADWIEHLYLQPTGVSVIEYSVFLTSLALFVSFPFM